MRVLITGTSRGLGQALYRALDEDHEVVALNRDVADLSDRASVRAAAEHLRASEAPFDLAILNAGVGDFHGGQASCAKRETIMEVNFLSYALLMSVLDDHVKHYLIVSSISADLGAADGRAFVAMRERNRLRSYGTSKRYLSSWGNEFRRRRGARVSAVWPGIVATSIWEGPLDLSRFHVRKLLKLLYYRTHTLISAEESASRVLGLIRAGIQDGVVYDVDGRPPAPLPAEEPGLWDAVRADATTDARTLRFYSCSEDTMLDVGVGVALVLVVVGVTALLRRRRNS